MFLLPFLKPRPILKLILAVAFTTGWLHAAPYGPEGKAADYRQPDGTTVGVRVFGDEYYAVAETLEGYTVVYDKDKVLTYGNLSADGKKIVSTGIRASNKPDHAKLQNSGIKKSIRLSPEGRKAAVAKGLQRMRADNKGRVTPQSVQYYSEAAANPGAQFSSSGESELPPPPPSYAPPAQTRLGNYVGLCLLVDFSDQAGTIDRNAVDDYCNKPGYTGYNNSGSIYDYFLKQSGGRLRYNNVVTAYVRVPNPKTYYDDGSDLPWGSSKAQNLVIDALNVLMAQGFDFTQISRNASGNIYSINVFYAGTCASAWSTGLWPSSWAIPTKTVDAANGIKAYSYQMTDMGTALDIGTFCHENGHMLLDYPDLYPYNGNAANFGNYSLMSGGNHADGGRHPTNIDPYLKNASGWTDIIDLDSTSHQRCTIQADSNLFYRYRNPAKLNEYFIFEVRDNTGYEGPYGGSAASVNPSAGLVAYHVREDGSNTNSSIFTASNPNCDYTKPYEILLVEANQPTAKTPWYDDPTPDTSDAFKSTGKSEISDITTPALKFWDATGRNTASGAVIHSISADGPTMTFVAGAGTPTGSASIVLSRTKIDSFCDFGTTAAPQTFSICNGGGGTLAYTISDNQTWLSCTPTSDTATTESDTITVNFTTSGLAAGAYSATITVTDPLATPSTKTITVNLTVNARPVMTLSVASIVKAGIAGSSGPQTSFAIKNTGGGTMDYAMSKTQPWFSLTPSSGTVVGETDTIYMNFDATSLARGTYTDTITITSASATNSPRTIPVTFTVDGADMILSAPNSGENWVRGTSQNITWVSGIGGNVKLELLKNGVLSTTISASTPNDNSFAWSIPVSQTLGTNYRIRITSVETPAATDVSFTDFSIVPPPIYYASMDTNPGWTLQGQWAWGAPTGAGGDPNSGYNGSNVIGYNLSGQYANSLAETFATTPSINCTGYSNVQLSFRRWLGVETNAFDHAYIRVSNNGTSWTTIYANPASTITDTSWTLDTYDISAVADGQATVYVRWVMGTTDSADTFCGWNIDEVLVEGVLTGGGYAVVNTQSGGTTAVTEGGATDTYTLHLSEAPTSNVTVTISPNAQLSVSPTSLTFTTANWTTPQTVTVTAFNDLANEFSHTGSINHSATSADTNYNAIGIDGLMVDITDNDNAAPVVNSGNDQSVTLTGVSWTPADVGPLAWYDATDATTITQVAGAVSQWADKVGTSHMVQATGANQPLSGTTTINGLNSISFDGTNDALKTATNPFGASISNAMMMGVFNVGTINTGTTLFSLTGSGTNANRWQSHAPWSDGTLYFDCGGAGAPNRISTPSGWVANQNKLLGFYCSTTDNLQQVWVDGTNFLSDATGHAVTTVGGLSLGYDGGGSYDNCRMGEVVVINGAVSATNRQKLEGFLAHKWGLAGSLPGAHPYKIQPPTNGAAIAYLDGTVSDANGDSFTTAWTLVSGPASVSFGNVNAVDTTASFSVAGTYTLRLTASDPGASISDDIIITVNASSDYAITYAGNTQSNGTPPATQFKSPGVNLTLATNSGGLIKTGHSFAGWNTAANGGGTDYATGSTYSTDANLALYAKWIPDTYPVTYSANGATSGTAPTDQTKTYGVSLTLATNSGTLAKTGYTFAGWNTAADGTGTTYAVSAAYTTNAPVTLYAKWTIMTYAVTYNINSATSGTLPGNQTKTYGIDLTLQTNTGSLARTGYTFAGWNTLANGTGTSYAEGAVYTANATLALFAKWTPDTYPVTYNANGADSGLPPADQTKTYAVNLTLATNSGGMIKAGYAFAGWNTAANGSGTTYAAGASYTTNASLSLYAQWKTYDLLFRDDFDSAKSTSLTAPGTRITGSVAVTYANTSATDLAVNGMLTWDNSGDRDTNNEQTTATGTQNFRCATNLVSYVAGKVWEVSFDQRVAWSNPLTFGLTDAASGQTGIWNAWDNANYEFAVGNYGSALRYDTDNDLGTNLADVAGVFPSQPNSVDTHRFRIRFDEPAGTATVWINGIQRATKTGLDFEAANRYLTWGEPGNYAGAIDNLQAKVIATDINYTITYNGNGSTGGSAPTTQTMPLDENLAVQGAGSLLRSSYTFAGWNTSTDGSGTSYSAGALYATNNNVTLYAQWAPVTYTVSYDANGADSGTPPANQSKSHGLYLTLATNTGNLAKTGSAFSGWNTLSDGSGTDYAAGGTYTTDAPIILYAKWAEPSYTITFDSAGGSAVTAITQNFGTAVTAPSAPARTGYSFGGWSPAVPATMPANDLTITAQWTANNYTVIFDANGGGTPSSASMSVTYGSTYGSLATITRTGHTFNGWFTASSGGTLVTSATTVAITGAQTLYAQWTVKTYTITFDSAGGSAVTAITQDFGTAVTPPTAPTRSGYAFADWSPAVPATMPAADLTVTAQWTANTYTVNFDANGGNAPSPTSKSVTYASVYGALATITRNGYTLAGWFTAASGGTQITDVSTVATAADHILYAQWTANTYAVTLDKQNGTGGSASVTATYGSAMPAATAPTRTGYTFGGYYSQVSGAGSQYYTAAMASAGNWDITAASTLYAKWTINTYTLTYTAGAGGTLTGQAVQSAEHGANGTQVTAVPNSGYNFVKWSDNVMTASRTDTNVTADLTVSATFIINPTVPNVIGLAQATAESNLVAASLVVGTVTTRNHATIPAGSVITQSPSGGSSVVANSPVNLVVSLGPYSQTQYATSDVPVSGTVVGTYVSTQTSDNGYETIKEIESGGAQANRYSYLEHKWTFSLASSNTLTFHVEAWHNSTQSDDFQFAYSTTGANGTYNNMLTVSKTSDNNAVQSFTMPPGISGTVHVRVIDTDRTQGNKVLDTLSIDQMYFLATVNAPTATVPNVVGLSQSTAETDLYNASLVLGTVTAQNHATVPAGSVISQSPVGSTSAAQNSAVDLVVSSGPLYLTVTFDANGGSTASPASKQVTINTDYGTLASTSRTGYTFNGWFTATSGGTEVTSATIVTASSDHTLYAQWTLNTYTLTYTADTGGSLTGQTSQTVNHGATGSIVTAVPNAGYNFIKWSDDVMTASRTDTNITAGLSVTANFALISYTSWATGTFTNGTLGNQNMAFDFDGDGLATGVEWVIGGDPTLASDARDKKPVFDNTSDPNYFIYSYRRTDVANADPKTNIIVEYGNDLNGWQPAVEDADNITITPTNDGYGAGVDKVEVKIKRSVAAPGGRLFSRLKVVVAP